MLSRLTKLMLIAIPAFIGLLFSCTANAATMRCGTSLISEGDSAQIVREKCGAPGESHREGPARLVNGTPVLNAAQIDIWVYGPEGGSYRYLRFIDDKLVQIQMQRR